MKEATCLPSLLTCWHFRLLYAIKTWENIKKSTFFQEYGRLLPWTADKNQPFLNQLVTEPRLEKRSRVPSVSRNRCFAVQLVTWERIQHHECSKQTVHEERTPCHYQETVSISSLLFVFINICKKVIQLQRINKYVPRIKIKHFIHTPQYIIYPQIK